MIANIESNTGGKAAKTNEADSDFKNLVDLLAVVSEAENRLAQLESATNEAMLEVVDDAKKEYAQLQEKIVQAEVALELVVRAHPEWLREKKTIKTPYGSVSLKDNPPSLVVANEEVAVVLIEAEAEKNKNFDASQYLRSKKELNLEALAGLADDDLKKFRIKRVQGDTFTVKAAKLDLGKAVKQAADAKG